MDKFQIPVSFDSANRRKDRSIRMSFSSMFEMNTEDYMEIDKQLQQSGWLVFASKAVNDIDIPTEDFDNDISKSQSTQVRDVLWILFKMKGNKSEDKEAWSLFYRKQMQSFKGRILEEIHKIEEIK